METDDDVPNARSSNLGGLLGQRGRFSLRNGSDPRSDVPRNTLSIQPSDALFGRSSCCPSNVFTCSRLRRTCRRYRKSWWTCLSALACMSAVLLLVGSITYHLHRKISSSKEKPHKPIPPEVQKALVDELFDLVADDSNGGGDSIESYSPLGGNVPRVRAPLEVLFDSREVGEILRYRRGALIDLLSKAKGRYRRSLPNRADSLQKFFDDCNSPDCNITSVRSKLDAVLSEIQQIKSAMKLYEKSLKSYTKSFFRDFSVAYPSSETSLSFNSLTTERYHDKKVSEQNHEQNNNVIHVDDRNLNPSYLSTTSHITAEDDQSEVTSPFPSDVFQSPSINEINSSNLPPGSNLDDDSTTKQSASYDVSVNDKVGTSEYPPRVTVTNYNEYSENDDIDDDEYTVIDDDDDVVDDEYVVDSLSVSNYASEIISTETEFPATEFYEQVDITNATKNAFAEENNTSSSEVLNFTNNERAYWDEDPTSKKDSLLVFESSTIDPSEHDSTETSDLQLEDIHTSDHYNDTSEKFSSLNVDGNEVDEAKAHESLEEVTVALRENIENATNSLTEYDEYLSTNLTEVQTASSSSDSRSAEIDHSGDESYLEEFTSRKSNEIGSDTSNDGSETEFARSVTTFVSPIDGTTISISSTYSDELSSDVTNDDALLKSATSSSASEFDETTGKSDDSTSNNGDSAELTSYPFSDEFTSDNPTSADTDVEQNGYDPEYSSENVKVTNSSTALPETTTSIPSEILIEDSDEVGLNSSPKTLHELGIHSALEKELLAKSSDNSNPDIPISSGGLDDNVRGISLQEAQSQKVTVADSNKWVSKVVSGAGDVIVPTGPGYTVGTGEAINTAQQLSYIPTGGANMMIPYQMCFYGSPNMKGYPSIREKENGARTVDIHSFVFPPLPAFGLKGSSSTSPPPPALPQQNFFSIYMNNNPVAPTAPMGFQGFPAPFGGYMFPSQPHQSKYFHNGHQGPPLFCGVFQAPFSQYPTFPGSEAFHHAKCLNCNDSKPLEREETLDESEFKNFDAGSLICPEGTSRCKDDLLCIPSVQWCDGRVHCSDASDELFCSCRDRVAESRRCDGYADCPKGEDELGCFDCPLTSFSCGTWDEDRSCIPLGQRCDGKEDCTNGRDEVGCSLISPSLMNVSHLVSFGEGFLVRNWRGTWYPVCVERGKQTWAEQACEEYSGDQNGDFELEHLDIPETFRGLFLTHLEDGNFVLQHHCKGHLAVHIRCPATKCGLRPGVNDENSPDFISRFRRLIEDEEAPAPSDESLRKWWEVVKMEIEEEFKVRDVVARLVPLDGTRRKRGDGGRVVGGRSSAPHDWPWAIALYRDGNFHCGGVILDNQWIMTAAHCVSKYDQHYYEIRAGMLRRFSFSPMEQVERVVQVVVKENYEERTMKNDLAVLRLASPLLLNAWVRPICLPAPGNKNKADLRGPAPGSYCVAVGWGALKEHGTDPDQLREVTLPILPKCKRREDVEGNEICAGYKQGGKDTCQGDSGGPLMCRDSSKTAAWYLAGVVSHGDGCARPDEPGVYTRVSLYIDWLADHTRDTRRPSVKPVIKCPGFKCTSHPNLCIPSHLRCNGLVDCLEAEDEKDCPLTRNLDDPENEIVSLSVKTKKRDNTQEMNIFNYSQPEHYSTSFRCDSLVQRIPENRRCDGIQDCEDSTDERNCTCRDRVALERPSAICDGVLDCVDRSDEVGCFACSRDYFNCRRSRQCIHLSRRCDGVSDCSLHEDERNCLALSANNKSLTIELSGIPTYATQGLLLRNSGSIWSIVCGSESDGKRGRLSSKACNELGLNGYEKYESVPLSYRNLLIEDESGGFLSNDGARSVWNCSALYVTCSKVIVSQSSSSDLHTWDWEARIRVNGSLTCTAAILTSEWLIGSLHCFPHQREINRTYIIAEMGLRRIPPTFLRVISTHNLAGTDILLLRLERPITEERHMRPIQIPFWQSPEDFQSCIAINDLDRVKLRVDKKLSVNHLFFTRMHRPARGCRSKSWTGVIACNSFSGWFPAAVYVEQSGSCGFQLMNVTNILEYVNEIREVTETHVRANATEIICDGYRCLGGLCISQQKICNGWPDCPYADDEEEEQCQSKGDCGRMELRCSSGGCIHRSQFGDGVSDCSDSSDEPEHFPCAQYLRLVAPHRICDGTRNCFDKSDEMGCGCGKMSYKCERTEQCIPREFLCDGHEDCPDGDDESSCFGLQKFPRILKTYEFKNMSYGVWHSMCEPRISKTQANQMCRKAGYFEAIGVDLKLKTPTFPVVDPFSEVKLNNATKFALRGDRPFLTLKSGPTPCHVAFITCQ